MRLKSLKVLAVKEAMLHQHLHGLAHQKELKALQSKSMILMHQLVQDGGIGLHLTFLQTYQNYLVIKPFQVAL